MPFLLLGSSDRSRRYRWSVAPPRNEFERVAAASQAAEENRPPSRWHRVWVAALGAVCLLQWSSLVIAIRTGWDSLYLGGGVSAIANTVLLAVFVHRLRRTGDILERRKRR